MALICQALCAVATSHVLLRPLTTTSLHFLTKSLRVINMIHVYYIEKFKVIQCFRHCQILCCCQVCLWESSGPHGPRTKAHGRTGLIEGSDRADRMDWWTDGWQIRFAGLLGQQGWYLEWMHWRRLVCMHNGLHWRCDSFEMWRKRWHGRRERWHEIHVDLYS